MKNTNINMSSKLSSKYYEVYTRSTGEVRGRFTDKNKAQELANKLMYKEHHLVFVTEK